MEDDKLVFMANQIAAYFKAYPEPDAIAGVSDHIKSFWTPGMRRSLTQYLDTGRHDADKIVVMAVLGPAALVAVGDDDLGESPVRNQTDGPAELGQAASDAG